MSPDLFVLLVLGSIVSIIFVFVIFFNCLGMYNAYFECITKLKEIKYKIKIAVKEEKDLTVMLKEQMEKYISYEKEMLGNTTMGHENLLALADKFPEMKTDEVIRETTVALKKLRHTVTGQQEDYNSYVQKLHNLSMGWPSRVFRPKNININSYTFLDIKNEKE